MNLINTLQYCKLSGGEKTRVVIGLLLALIRSQKQDRNFPFLVLDEFDAQLDEPGHRQVMELLQREVGAKLNKQT
jgi:chromosome segregation ATPase